MYRFKAQKMIEVPTEVPNNNNNNNPMHRYDQILKRLSSHLYVGFQSDISTVSSVKTRGQPGSCPDRQPIRGARTSLE